MWPDTAPIVRAFEELSRVALAVAAALVVALVLALLAAPARAQPKCWPDTSGPITIEIARAQTVAKPGAIAYSASSAGLIYGWLCTAPDGVAHRYVAGGKWAAFVPDWAAVADTLARGTDADRAAAWQRYVTATTIDVELQPLVDAVRAALPLPAPETWIVARNSTYATRPTYPLVDGVRSTTSNGRVDVGAPCDCAAAKVVSGSTTYCGVLGRADTVAVCSRAN